MRVWPDVFTLAAGPPALLPRMMQTWLPGHMPPVFALEVVSDDWKKDYEDAPAKYALLGAAELVIFDADAARGEPRAPRVALQVYRREADGAFVQVYRGPGPARVLTLDAWLLARSTSDPAQMLRVARDAAGADVVPTEAEHGALAEHRADDEKRRADDERRRADDERRRADDERRRADALAAELARLRAKLGDGE